MLRYTAPKGDPLAGFTPRARKVLQLANQEAHRLNHDYIGTEHILLGLVKEGVGVAAQVLKARGMSLRKARREVEKVTPRSAPQLTLGALQRNAEARGVMNRAIDEAYDLNHRQAGTGHLLLALLSVAGCQGGQLLTEAIVNPDELRTTIVSALRKADWEEVEEYWCYEG